MDLTPGPREDQEQQRPSEEALKLAALYVHWTYCRRANCQCEDAGIGEIDVDHGRRVAEALWPVAYRAGREDAAKEVISAADDHEHADLYWEYMAMYGRAKEIARGQHPRTPGEDVTP